MLGQLILLLLLVWTGAIAWISCLTLRDKYLWIPLLLALAGVFGCLLPFVVTFNIALVANAVTLTLFIVSLERLKPRRLRATG